MNFPRDDNWERTGLHSRGVEGHSPEPVPAPAEAPNPWRGITLFSAHGLSGGDEYRDQRDKILALCPFVDTVVLKADGGDRADPSIAATLRQRGARVVWWRSWDEPSDLRGVGVPMVGQAEGLGQRARCEENVCEATITNVTLSDDRWLERFEAVFVECYTNLNDNARPLQLEYEARKRGARFVVPCFGVGLWGEANGVQVRLADYLQMPGVGDSWSLYLAETMTLADADTLREWRAEHPK